MLKTLPINSSTNGQGVLIPQNNGVNTLKSKKEEKTSKIGQDVFSKSKKASDNSNTGIGEKKLKNIDNLIKFSNRTCAAVAVGIDNPILEGISLGLKLLRRGSLFLESGRKLCQAPTALKFIHQTQQMQVENQSRFELARNYVKNLSNSFAFGSCEERRRLVKAALSIVLLGALSAQVAYHTGMLEEICQMIGYGQEESVKYAAGLVVAGAQSIHAWKNCRRLLAIETAVHKGLVASSTKEKDKKRQKRMYGLQKLGLLLGRYFFKLEGLKLPEKVLSASAAALALRKNQQRSSTNDAQVGKTDKKDKKKIKDKCTAGNNQERSSTNDAQVGKTDKKDKKKIKDKWNNTAGKAKNSLTGWRSCADNSTRLAISLLIFCQLYYFMTLLTNPMMNEQYDAHQLD